jgi:hypothetical protein
MGCHIVEGASSSLFQPHRIVLVSRRHPTIKLRELRFGLHINVFMVEEQGATYLASMSLAPTQISPLAPFLLTQFTGAQDDRVSFYLI